MLVFDLYSTVQGIGIVPIPMLYMPQPHVFYVNSKKVAWE